MAQARLYFQGTPGSVPKTSRTTFVLCLGNTSQTLRRSVPVDSTPMKASYAALLSGIETAASLGVRALEIWRSSRSLAEALMRTRGSAEHGMPCPLDPACARAAVDMACT